MDVWYILAAIGFGTIMFVLSWFIATQWLYDTTIGAILVIVLNICTVPVAVALYLFVLHAIKLSEKRNGYSENLIELYEFFKKDNSRLQAELECSHTFMKQQNDRITELRRQLDLAVSSADVPLPQEDL